MKQTFLKPVFYDKRGNICSDERFIAAGRYSGSFTPLLLKDLIPIPEDTILFQMPGRHPVVFTENLQPLILEDRIPVAAFIPPGYTQTLLCSAVKHKKSEIILPLFSYTAVGMYRDKLYIAAIHIDKDIRHKISAFDDATISRRGADLMKLFPQNRLVAHLVEKCAIGYRCPNARNLIMKRFEAPLPVSPKCNSRCIGCISFQKNSSKVISPQNRLGFVPSEDELYEIAEYHIRNVRKPILSFGQGCEGEPLLEAERISNVIKRIKKRYKGVTVNINTNGSNPDALRYLFECGLDSARISMNSAQEELYTKYYKPVGYSFSDVIKSISLGKKLGKWISINYFVFPGITDSEEEFRHFHSLIQKHTPKMVQFRNFNIDPDWYLDSLNIKKTGRAIGIKKLITLLKEKFPFLRFGYFNPFISRST